MPTYRVYPLDFDGNIIGSGQRAKWDTDRDARVFALMVQAAGGSFEIWRDTIKVFPLTSARSGYTVFKSSIDLAGKPPPFVGA
ncbi:hypothetical protein [Lichenicoccus roseus]|uniref:Uncharacterized protein n=1 Tax=Lichenicoccus roseus TaxID=2683649 RepID=A0A5R9J3Y3_9PROT|nr:hypothetical protein [Lichenicoccus roseus]TLU71207.1 hypothetical protein FE263_18755 [Lichenicoccus roseus]